jgi:ankyrin repeat protein
VVADFGEPVFLGLRHLGSVERGGDKPAHIVIKGENHHVLEALQFTHAGKVDCVYIDPPYNTGARDWKYDNNYVDEADVYRHSKWLAFIERRLLLAQQLLNPEDSVLIVTIDEKEYLRLGLLLEQAFANLRGPGEETPLSVAVCLGQYGGSAEMVLELLRAGARAETRDSSGFTVLMHAVRCHNQIPSVVEALLQHGAKADAIMNGGTSVLHLAVMGQKTINARIVELLIRGGANVDLRDRYNMTALLYAANRPIPQNTVLKLLRAAGATPEARDYGGNGLIFYAIQHHQYARIPALLSVGANINERDQEGRTVLMRATRSMDRRAVPYLLQHGANPNLTDREGRTALMYAVLRKSDYLDEPNITALLSAGAKASVRDLAGTSVLDYARLPDHHPMYRLLVKSGAPEPKEE